MYTQLQKKRTTYMYLPLSNILTSDSYVICGYIALKFCMLLSNRKNSIWVKFYIFYDFYFQRL